MRRDVENIIKNHNEMNYLREFRQNPYPVDHIGIVLSCAEAQIVFIYVSSDHQ